MRILYSHRIQSRDGQSVHIEEMVAALPLDQILLETDSPFLTPHPRRGTRNEPANIPLVAEKIAQLHKIPLAQVAEQTCLNAKTLFNW